MVQLFRDNQIICRSVLRLRYTIPQILCIDKQQPKFDRQIGSRLELPPANAEITQAEVWEGVDTSQAKIKSYNSKVDKSGTGCVTMINDHLYEGRYTPTNAYGKREAHNIYAKTREECEEKLAAMIVEVKAKIDAEKGRLKSVNESVTVKSQ